MIIYLFCPKCLGRKECPDGQWLTGFKLKVEPYQGVFVDDTAANDLEMNCNWSDMTINGNGDHWGEWGNFVQCPHGT